MLLRSLHVECLKTLRGPVDLEFDEGLTVVGGPNESGKSTLREALNAALFLPAGSTKKDVKDLFTWGSSEPPQVRLAFRLQGEEWRIEKVFGRKKGGAALHRGDRLVAEDNDAQTQLEDLLRQSGEADWIRLMWGEQGDVQLGLETPETLEARLHAAAGSAVSPQVDRLREVLEKDYEKLWTPKTGKPRKAVQDARQEEEIAEHEVAEAEAAIAESDRRAAEVRDLQARLIELEAEAEEGQAALQEQRQSLEAWTGYRLAAQRVEAERATRNTLRSWLDRREQLQKAIADLAPQAEAETARRAELQAEPPTRDEIDRLQAELRLLELLEARDAAQELEGLKAPTAEEIREIRKLGGAAAACGLQARIVAEVDLEARLKAGGFEATLGKLEKGETREVSAPSQFELILPGIARIEVRTADGSTGDAAKLGPLLAKYGLSSADEAEDRYARAEALRSRQRPVDADQLKTLQKQFPGAKPDPDRRAALPQEIAAAESGWKEAQQRYAGAQAELQKLLQTNAAGRLEAARAALEDHERNAPEDPETRLERTEAALADLEGQLDRPEGEEVTPESLRAQEEALAAASAEANALRAQVNQEIGAVGAQGELYVRYQAAVENLARVRKRVAEVNAEAYSVRLLRDTLQELQGEFEEAVVSPLQERLTLRFGELTNGRYLGVEVNRSEDVEGVVPREIDRAPVEALSFGTQEQLAFLARLTLAELLGDQFVIFDDNLVHTDDERMGQALRMIEESAKKAQVIVLTCHPERYTFAKKTRTYQLTR